MIHAFQVIYRHCPEMPDAKQIISLSRRMICVNLSAKKDTNVYVLTQ